MKDATNAVTALPSGPPLDIGHTQNFMAGHSVLWADKGNLVLTAGTGKSVKMWRCPQPWLGDFKEIRNEVQRITGMRLNEDGSTAQLNYESWNRLNK